MDFNLKNIGNKRANELPNELANFESIQPSKDSAVISGAKALGYSGKSLFHFTKDVATLRASYFFDDDFSISEHFRNVAQDNIDYGYATNPNHYIANFIGSSIPYIIGDVLTDGALQGVSVGVSGAVKGASIGIKGTRAALSKIVSTAAKEKSAYDVSDLVSTALRNKYTPSTFTTPQFAREMTYGGLTAIQGALTLNNDGNVKIDRESLALNAALGLGIPILGRGIRSIGNINYAKLGLRTNKKGPKLQPNDQLKKEFEDINESTLNENINKSALDTEININESTLSKSALNDPDLIIDLDKNNPIVNNRNYGKNENLTTNIYENIKSIMNLKEKGFSLNNVKYDIDSPDALINVSQEYDKLKSIKQYNGAKKVTTWKKIQELREKSPKDYEEYKDIFNKIKAIPYNSIGSKAEREKGNKGDFYYSFYTKNNDAILNKNDLIKINNGRKKGNDIALQLNTAYEQSSDHNFKSNFATIQALHRNLNNYRKGMLSSFENWNKLDEKQILDNIKNNFDKYAEYFVDPVSSGYLKLSKNWELGKKLIDCLIRNI